MFLVPDVISYNFFVSTYSGNKVASCPKTFSGEIARSFAKSSSYIKRALPLYIPNDLSYRVFWRNRDTHMDMIETYMSFDNLALSLFCKFTDSPRQGESVFDHTVFFSGTSVSKQCGTCSPKLNNINFGCCSSKTSFSENFERFTEGRFSMIPGTVKL